MNIPTIKNHREVATGVGGFIWSSTFGEAYYDELVIQGWDEVNDAVTLYSLANNDAMKTAIDTLFLVKEGISSDLSKFVCTYLHHGDSAQEQLINAIAPTVALHKGIAVNSPTFNALGIVNNSSSYVRTGIIDNTHITLNDEHTGVYNRTNDSNTVGTWDSVAQNSGAQRFGIRVRGDGDQLVCYSHGTPDVQSIAAGEIRGWYTCVRRSASDQESYQNGVSLGNGASTSGSQSTRELYYGARNNNGSATNITARNYAYYSVGEGLTDAQVLTYFNGIQAHQTTLGRNV